MMNLKCDNTLRILQWHENVDHQDKKKTLPFVWLSQIKKWKARHLRYNLGWLWWHLCDGAHAFVYECNRCLHGYKNSYTYSSTFKTIREALKKCHNDKKCQEMIIDLTSEREKNTKRKLHGSTFNVFDHTFHWRHNDMEMIRYHSSYIKSSI